MTLNVSRRIVDCYLFFSTLVEVVDISILIVEDSRTRCYPFLFCWEVGVYSNDVGCVEVCLELVSLYFLHDLSGNYTFLNDGLLD